VNLAWALARMRAVWLRDLALEPLLVALLDEADAILREDLAMCDALATHGAALLPDEVGVLTHCNTGGLATGGIGTALGVVFAAAAAGKRVRVFADETRPLLQGARLTAWECNRQGVPVTVLVEGAAASLLSAGHAGCVVVGADRIAANGDTANKVGTLGLALLAHRYKVPFYVAAPSSSIDASLASGERIPIEQRAADEVTRLAGVAIAPDGVDVYNPAFDVTPAELISAIVTETGVHRPPFRFKAKS
jgi:methylthioribose-1-phosphate isomerase